MATEIKLPEIGEGIDSAEVAQVLVSEGDEVEKDQPLLEIESEKATTEVPSSESGTVATIHVAAGDTIKPGDVLVTLNGKGEDPGDKEENAKEEKETAKDEEKADDEKQADESPEDEKATDDESEQKDPHSKKAKREKAESGNAEKKEPKQEQKKREKQDEPDSESTDDTDDDQPNEPDTASASHGDVAASPAVRRFAREVNVELDDVDGSGPGGRITRDDVQREASAGVTGTAAADETEVAGQPSSDPWGNVHVERLTKLQATMAQRMHDSWTTIPRVTNFDDADVTELENLRQANQDDYAEQGIKLTMLPLVIKAVALALKRHPTLNAALDIDQGEVTFKDYVNIGVAVDSERGLVVPSLHHADLSPVPKIARRLNELSDLARANKLRREDLLGSTFTISNLGAIGGTYATPIINPPEVAILLLGRARKRRVFVHADDDEEQARLMMPLSLSYDHRLVDGATAARFLNELIEYLEAPGRLLMAP